LVGVEGRICSTLLIASRGVARDARLQTTRMSFAAIVVGGYLLGSCPWGYWLVRLFRGEDVRSRGSGATGGSNVWRAYGPRLGITVIVLDVLKGFVPALVGVLLVSNLCGILAGAAAMAGHARPLFLGFRKGGKMVATAGGVLLAVAPWVALLVAALWLVVFAIWRYPSVASIVSAIGLPIAAVAVGYDTSVIAFTLIAAVGIVWLHRANLRRLRAGTEHRVRLRGTAHQT
jgi:glycerol-3-phosphate acyltransferase PlsY